MPDIKQAWSKSTDIFQFFKGFGWTLNFFFVALPWLLVLLVLNSINIYLNMHFNHNWAQGNFFLISNTFYLATQSFLSFWLVAEFPFLLKRMKLIRFISFIFAFIYNIIYSSILVDYVIILYNQDKKSDVVTVFQSMVFAYNLILHASIIPVNSAIISKEFSLEFF